MLQLERTPHMQMSLDLNSCVHIFEHLGLSGFHTAAASLPFYHSASQGMSRGYSETTRSEVNYSGLRTGGLVHTIHNHLETTANASTKAKLKVEPLNSLDSSLFLFLSLSLTKWSLF